MKKVGQTVKVAKPHVKRVSSPVRVGKGYTRHKAFKF